MAHVKQYVFFDFEMLCAEKGMTFEKMEAIRLGAVKYDIETESTCYFDQYIRPINRKPLTAFCKKLTGITDADLAEANDFKTVFEQFLTWVGGVKKSRFFSWSNSDLTRLKLDAAMHHVPLTTMKKIETRYIDFQAIFTKRVAKNNPSVESALGLYGLSFIGEKHHPMYDAYNTLRIYLSFLNKPLESDLLMLKQFVFAEVPDDRNELNQRLLTMFHKDITAFFSGLTEMYCMKKDAVKMVRKVRQLVKKYENILLNRSGLFSKEIVENVGLLVQFYHDLLIAFEEHHQHSAKLMILDETMVEPIYDLILKQG
ncbi:Inhibitor of the KinA pathway to sporulation, predicted exonuclease [Evansella caseinilytica]|uniref:Inhibitor of the KinA pathway to sporulation, predicted exonuclease n=1 Tax=Evansella caseinilytica TaxID=1503961 RepID=A0A1H3P1L3_9BACI|nr:3'-5' exonuclease [Evansella caseinilytica]SDY94685.1 Inhibitor of the KinA pathway to sporulation, predicted exonuclease [Evansella caseinilytica]